MRAPELSSLVLCAASLIQGHSVLTLAGDGTAGWLDGYGLNTKFNGPRGLSVDNYGNLIVSDTYNNRMLRIYVLKNVILIYRLGIRKISIFDRLVTTFSGTGTAGASDGSAAIATFNWPTDVTSPDSQVCSKYVT